MLYDKDPYVSQAAKVVAKWLGAHLPATAPA
jgi:hypothetical protein